MAIRALTSGMQTAIAAGTVRPAIFYEGVFDNGSGADAYLRLWTGLGSIVWNTYTWLGAGELIAISNLDETTDLSAVGFQIKLNGMPSVDIGLALGDVRQGRSGKLWMGLFDSSGNLIADPYPLRRGRLDYSVIDDTGETCTIGIQYEDRLIDLERPRERRFTSADQQIDYPTDLGFEFVPNLQDKSFQWG